MAEEVKKGESTVVETPVERNAEYFAGRLPAEKDTFTREEVAAELYKEAEYSTRKASKGKVSEEALIAVQAELKDKDTKLSAYQEAEFNSQAAKEFKKLNGDKSRMNDLVKLAGLKQGMKPEEMSEAIVALKTNKNYEFLFKKVDSGKVPGGHKTKETKSSTGSFQAPSGAEKFLNMFKKKK